MQPITLRIFVSSTWLDLKPERMAVESLLQRFRETKFVGMEYFGSRNETTRETSLIEVDRSDLYVGIIAGRYGSGITEAEYDRACAGGKPCFIYVKADSVITSDERDTEHEKQEQLAAFKRSVADAAAGHTVPSFSTPHELASMLASDLHNWLFERYLGPALAEAAAGQLPPNDSGALSSDLRRFAGIQRDLIAMVSEEHQRLDEQRRVALQAFYQLTYEIPQALAAIPGQEALRETIVLTNIQQLERLLQVSDGAPDVLRELATNYRLLASIALESEQWQKALEAYRASATHTASLALLKPDNDLYQRDRAVSHINAGLMLERLNDPSGARAEYVVGLRTAKQAAILDSRWQVLAEDVARRLARLDTSRASPAKRE